MKLKLKKEVQALTFTCVEEENGRLEGNCVVI